MPCEPTKKVLITGATGAIGQSLIPVFLENNYHILAVTRDMGKAQKISFFKEVEFIQLDIFCQSQNLNVKCVHIKLINNTTATHAVLT